LNVKDSATASALTIEPRALVDESVRSRTSAAPAAVHALERRRPRLAARRAAGDGGYPP
jgi:hypothetical protein